MGHPIDTRPQGDPEMVVYLPPGSGSWVGLHIKGVGARAILAIREDAAGYPVSCAINMQLTFNMVPYQSNPHRRREKDRRA